MTRSRFILFLLVALASPAARIAGGERITLGKDGSLTGGFHLGSAGRREIVLRFGLPAIPAERQWREGQALRGLWITNGVRYSQTVLLKRAAVEQAPPGDAPPAVLLVNIEGENTNSNYADATAALAVEWDGTRRELELEAGLVKLLDGPRDSLLGALEIPESGVRRSRGDTLQFYGSIPPSLKGSMTLKVPLTPIKGAEAEERLRDLVFEDELRKVLKSSRKSAAQAEPAAPALAMEEEEEEGKKRSGQGSAPESHAGPRRR
jgi:hypothetical protein